MEQITSDTHPVASVEDHTSGVTRRQMFAYTVAAPVLTVAVGGDAQAQSLGSLLGTLGSNPLPLTPPDITDYYDVGDSINQPSQLTMPLVRVEALETDKVRLYLPRLDQGCGISTAVGIMLADALGLGIDQVEVPLEDANFNLGANQITGGSANVRAFAPAMTLIAQLFGVRMLTAAGQMMGVAPTSIKLLPRGVMMAPNGKKVTFGQASKRAALLKKSEIKSFPMPKAVGAKALTGTTEAIIPRLDAKDIALGTKKFTMDQVQADWPQSPLNAEGKGALDLAKPTMPRMAPRINDRFVSVDNEAEVMGMPGVIAIVKPPAGRNLVVANSTGAIVPYPPAVAVMAETFGQAWDAAKALKITWANEGSLAKGVDSNPTISQKLKSGLPPAITVPLAERVIQGEFTYPAAVAASLEVECAIVDAGVIAPGKMEIWAGMQSPQATVSGVALDNGYLPTDVVAHVIPSGGSFGRRLFWDPVQIAAHVSQTTKQVCKLMYHRSDDIRHTRGRPPWFHRLAASVVGGRVVAYNQFGTAPRLDTRHGYGDPATSIAVSPPLGISQNGPAHLAVEQFFYKTMVSSPYNWGVQVKELLPADIIMNTVSYRSVHIQPFRSTEEMLVDEMAAAMKMDPYNFRMKYLRLDRARAVLKHVYEASGWASYNHVANRKLGRALGLAVHQEAKSFTAAVVEIDASDKTKGVRGKGAKVRKAWIAVDVGKPINISGLKAQFEGGLAESISLVLDAGLNFVDGLPKEFSYNNYRIARMNTFPRLLDIHVMPAIVDDPLAAVTDNVAGLAKIGGAGEVGMSATSGAIGNAYRRATGINPRNFPLNGLTNITEGVAAGDLPPKPSTFA